MLHASARERVIVQHLHSNFYFATVAIWLFLRYTVGDQFLKLWSVAHTRLRENIQDFRRRWLKFAKTQPKLFFRSFAQKLHLKIKSIVFSGQIFHQLWFLWQNSKSKQNVSDIFYKILIFHQMSKKLEIEKIGTILVEVNFYENLICFLSVRTKQKIGSWTKKIQILWNKNKYCLNYREDF